MQWQHLLILCILDFKWIDQNALRQAFLLLERWGSFERKKGGGGRELGAGLIPYCHYPHFLATVCELPRNEGRFQGFAPGTDAKFCSNYRHGEILLTFSLHGGVRHNPSSFYRTVNLQKMLHPQRFGCELKMMLKTSGLVVGYVLFV